MPTSPEPEGVAGPPAPAVAAPRQAVGLHGTVAAFDVAQDEWCDYIEHLEHYFTANDIREEDKRRAILLNAVGASTYRLIRTLVSPDKVTDVSFEEIVEKAKALLASLRNTHDVTDDHTNYDKMTSQLKGNDTTMSMSIMCMQGCKKDPHM